MAEEDRPVRIFFTDFWHPSTIEAIRKENWIYGFLSDHFNVVLSEDDPDFLVCSCSSREYLRYRCIRIFYTGENVRPRLHHCDYAFSFDYPETERNYRLPLYRFYPEYNELFKPRDPDKTVSEKRRFCAFVHSNPSARERVDFFDRLSRYKRIDSGGKVRNNVGYLVADKMSFLRNHKFSLAFESAQHPGYTTEKLLHALISDTIPIYWGNPEVGKDFNTSAFINCHDYPSFDEVVAVVKEIDTNEDLYRNYLSQPYFPDGVENEFCRQENIRDKFARIFESPRCFHPHSKLRQAHLDYYAYKWVCKWPKGMNVLKRIKGTIRKLGSSPI